MEAGERVPADMILLRTSDEGGSVFIRTDQLDGETVALPSACPACAHGVALVADTVFRMSLACAGLEATTSRCEHALS